MTVWRGKRSRQAGCLLAAGLIAGCAAPAAPFRPATLRQSAPESSVAVRPAVSPPERGPPKVAAAPEQAAQIRLAGHDAESETAETDTVTEKASGDDSGEPVASGSEPGGKHPIDLGTVLQLTDGQNPQVAFARARIQEAFAQLNRAQVLWLPSLRAGVTYDKHDGPAQQVDGNMLAAVSRSAFFTGFGGVLPGAATPAIPGLFANFQMTDAIFQPRIAQQTAASR